MMLSFGAPKILSELIGSKVQRAVVSHQSDLQGSSSVPDHSAILFVFPFAPLEGLQMSIPSSRASWYSS